MQLEQNGFYEGSASFELPPGTVVKLAFEGQFNIFGLNDDGEYSSVYGPASASDRALRFKVIDTGKFFVKTAKPKDNWFCTLLVTRADLAEVVDPDPVEIVVKQHQRSESLDSQIMRIMQNLIAQRTAGHEVPSYESENDFELDVEDPLSNYELLDMVNEEVLNVEEPVAVPETASETPSKVEVSPSEGSEPEEA